MNGRWNLRVSGTVVAVGLIMSACSGGGEPSEVASESSADATIPPTQPDNSDQSSTTQVDQSSGAGSETDDTSSPTPTTLPRETRTVISIDPDTGEETEVEIDIGAPTSYSAVVDAGVDAGTWDEVDGIRRVLDYVVGAIDTAQVPGVETVRSGELTAVLNRAWELNATGEYDPAELEPIRRRYERFAPPASVLDEIVAAAGESPSGFRAPAAPPECAPVDPDDFVESAWIAGCYTMIQSVLPDATLRVFFPYWHLTDPNLVNIAEVALGALVHSVETFRSLGAVGDMDVVFSAVDTIENTTADGEVFGLGFAWGIKPWDNDVVDRCAITTFPAAMGDLAAFEQTIAHEAWHCVQYYDGMEYSGGAQNWWVEGGAEFFSNVAYPHANDEHGWLDLFDSQLDTPISEMSYEVSPWWQHLSNEFSPLFVADLHREMMATSPPGVELLAGYEHVFHDFVADYVAGAVIDQSGEPLPKARYFDFHRKVVKADEGRELMRTIGTWSPTRWYVSYDRELRIKQSDHTTGALSSMVEFEKRADRAAWQGIHPEIRSKCEERSRFMVVYTSAATDSTSSTFDAKLTIDEIEEASCDPCVLGTWSLNLDTFENMIIKGMEAQGGGLPPGTSFSFGGAYYVAFEESDVVKEQRDGLQIIASLANVGGFTTTIDSFATGTYSADGERVTMTNLVESYNKVTTNLPGGGANSFPVTIASGDGTYECGKDDLTITVTGFEPISFTRVDKILEPQDAPTDPATATPDP